MHKKHFCKILASGIIILFIGFGIHPAFAVQDKTSTETASIKSKNTNPENIKEQFLVNINCFIIGDATEAWNRVSIDGYICFGYKEGDTPAVWTPSSGLIYTYGKYGYWKYEGKFYGRGGSYNYVDNYTHFYGIVSFRGLSLGAKTFLMKPGGFCFFIGFAEQVIISPDHP